MASFCSTRSIILAIWGWSRSNDHIEQLWMRKKSTIRIPEQDVCKSGNGYKRVTEGSPDFHCVTIRTTAGGDWDGRDCAHNKRPPEKSLSCQTIYKRPKTHLLSSEAEQIWMFWAGPVRTHSALEQFYSEGMEGDDPGPDEPAWLRTGPTHTQRGS